jgi:chromosome segregation ATPase
VTRDRRPSASATVRVENIGGIDETTVSLSPGITALIGPNATNRTSFLQALAGALGGTRVTLKGDSREGRVSLALDGERYTRRLEREDGSVDVAGEPYLEDPELVDLYAVLLEDNEVRRAVREDEDLRDAIMRPIDTEAIRREIGTLVDERKEIDEELDRLDVLAEELPELEAERRGLAEELEEVEGRLEEKRARRDRIEAEAPDPAGAGLEDDLDEELRALREARTDLERVEDDLSIERKSLESLAEERDRVEERYESIPAADEERLAVVEERVATLRDRKRSLESTVSELQRVIGFNETRLEESGPGLLDGLEGDTGDDGAVTDRLLSGEATVTCWTCGSEVQRSRIDGMVEQLRTLRRRKGEERNEVAEEIDELAEEIDGIEERREERDRLATRLEELADELDRREANVARLEERREQLEERVAERERAVAELEDARTDELLALQREVSELAFERDRVADRLEDVESEIEGIESELETREGLEDRRDAVSDELTELRTRIDRIETDAVEGFNSHMEALLDRLGYDNIERIWIEPAERSVREGGQRVTERTFDLHVVRRSGTGTTYEDTVEHLSESERELVGLVVALAGYLVHDVRERVPFMLLDSLEMIDGERLVDLVDYLEEYVPYLVVVLLPDHAAAFDRPEAPAVDRITEI